MNWDAINELELMQSVPDRFDIAFLDHDLDGKQMVMEREGTGTITAEYIAKMPKDSRPRMVVCHSYNAFGAQRTVNILRDVNVCAEALPFETDEFIQSLVNAIRKVGKNENPA